MLLLWRTHAAVRSHSHRKRSFMTLPSFSLPSLGRQYKDTQIFPYRREQIFDVVADVDRYSEFVPMCVGSTVFHNTRRSEKASICLPGADSPRRMVDREMVQAELLVGYPPFRERYVSQVVLERPWRIIATSAAGNGMFKYMKTVWEFSEQQMVGSSASAGRFMLDNGRNNCAQTLVRFSIEYEFASMLHAQAANLVFDRMAKSNLAAYLDRCQKLYGA
ncbi:Coenzyme Q-binding protein coq10a, mitochondrial [Coemansia spiralis]|uniref:Coenzyme Q-binding protein coq10a, mitochondrial n=2 Tax=Coemansia TaxID=4863 RepID=A0A9W8KXP8_9FUNG|nr:hypothetical protein BX070DRAFT_219368 [Coemansia spiralis]KAJ1994366.1 Coenzyme Q-binding protein coq10a, mitochondrial [Coemansia umbellata]KAJ2624325.1 Coenzyme Q-binding protein coq10a, mitochondrial [Coemansia sp. RSA 1358]KAJ2675928.1 Coenzyme Q-binding protein coq10a, mitochondrial [Coemansia spiralis]